MKIKREKLQITLPPSLLKEIDEDAKDSYLTRSAWVERAARFFLENNKEKRPKQRKIIDLNI